MPLIGVVCPRDGKNHSFEDCLQCHATGIRSCDAPEALIYSMSKDSERRQNVGYSATTLLQCARATALRAMYPYYESADSAWNKYRGTLIHAMFEHGSPEREGLIKEQRVVRYVDVDGEQIMVSGQTDEVDKLRSLLIDYKSTNSIPPSVKPTHEDQVNIYVWLLDGGVWQATGEQCDIHITTAGIQYVSLKTFKGGKMPVRVWPLEETEALVMERLRPLVTWHQTQILPKCNKYGSKWFACDCIALEQQLVQEGILL